MTWIPKGKVDEPGFGGKAYYYGVHNLLTC